jgi:hypothetical protein
MQSSGIICREKSSSAGLSDLRGLRNGLREKVGGTNASLCSDIRINNRGGDHGVSAASDESFADGRLLDYWSLDAHAGW